MADKGSLADALLDLLFPSKSKQKGQKGAEAAAGQVRDQKPAAGEPAKSSAEPKPAAEVLPKKAVSAKQAEDARQDECMIKTSIDGFLALVNERKRMTVPAAAKALGVKEEIVEDWATVLSRRGMVELVYPENPLEAAFVRVKR